MFANYLKKYKNLNVKGYASTSYPDIWWFCEWSKQTALPGYIPYKQVKHFNTQYSIGFRVHGGIMRLRREFHLSIRSIMFQLLHGT